MIRERTKGGCLKPLLIMAAFIALMAFICVKVFAPVAWFRFDEKRIAKLEENYAVSLENTVPVMYWVPRLESDTSDCFTFFTDDYKAFMDTFHGLEIVRATEFKSGKAARYTCQVRDGFYFTLNFKLTDSKYGKYKGSIESYTDPDSRPATSGRNE